MRKTAALLALAVALTTSGYFMFLLYQNVVLLKSSIDALNGTDDAPAMHYLVSGGIAIFALILALGIYPKKGETKNDQV